jgi:gliding motility-associated-like protein
MGISVGRFILVICAALFSGNASAQIISDFATNADGWTAPNDADATIAYSATGGNPTGNVFGTPFAVVLGPSTFYVNYYFVASGKFLGNRSSYYRGTLRFDAQQNGSGAAVQNAEVILTNSAGIAIYYFPATPFNPPAPPSWQTYSISLSATSGFWKVANDPLSTSASQTQIQNILATLANLQVRGLFRNANTTDRLDNVTMMPPILVTDQPDTTVICLGSTATFTTAASNNPTITYQWQRESTQGLYVDIANGGGYTGVTTATLSVNTTGNFGAGTYRVRVGGYAADDVFTATAALTINPAPLPPTVTGASSCTPSSLTLTAAGGTPGLYRWYTVATGGVASTAFTSTTFTTPVLSTTTTYYVAITNGNCESPRTPVTATIATPPAAPTVTGGTVCGSGSVTLTAAGGTTGQYRWYSVATGGTAIAGQANATFNTPVITTTTNYFVAINNGTCESARTQVTATINTSCSNQPPVIQAAESSTLIGGKVSLNLATRISDSDNNVDLSTLVIFSQPASGAKATIDANYNLNVDYTGLKFSGKETVVVRVCDTNAACVQQSITIEVIGDIRVYNALSPNKNGKNDVFFVEYIDLFDATKKNTVKIFNRWGDLVWEGTNYDNIKVVFAGRSKNDSDLPSGTYYYKIDFPGGRKSEVGYLELRR